MTKQPDQSFFRNLVLHCLDYVPNMPDEATMGHADTKTLRSIRSAVNIVRSDYYSWFMALIACIPEEDRKRYDRLATKILCLNLSDKNEELLLSCSVLVQVSHFMVMKHKCWESVDTAARSLSKVFDDKYRERFNETEGWSEFERHCETVERESERRPPKAEDLIDSVVRKEMTPWCKAVNEKSILDFWDKKELKKLLQAAEEEIATLKKRLSTLHEPNRQKVIVTRAYHPMLKSRIEEYEHPMLETQKSDPGWKKCLTASQTGFCLGCLLTVFYPEVKKETPRVKHSLFCQLWTEKKGGSGKENQNLENAVPLIPEPSERDRDLCATEIPRLPELILNFVQKHLDTVFGTCVLKNVRNKLFRELGVDVETCKYCEKQCVRKLIVCMDLYMEGCMKEALGEKKLI